MRIIAGRFKGRQLAAPEGLRVRPTSDRLRGTLFNVLAPHVADARVLDAFAGSGALGLEALSRGARHATFVEHDRRALTALEANVRACRAGEACAIIRDDFLRVERADDAFDLVLIDPPYAIENLDVVVGRAALHAGNRGRLVLEHSRRRESPEAASTFVRYRVLTAGDSALSFYARQGE
jgi:16S rRNA (guanine(966)-N(2))-methyltransferase RsmD